MNSGFPGFESQFCHLISGRFLFPSPCRDVMRITWDDSQEVLSTEPNLANVVFLTLPISFYSGSSILGLSENERSGIPGSKIYLRRLPPGEWKVLKVRFLQLMAVTSSYPTFPRISTMSASPDHTLMEEHCWRQSSNLPTC